MRELKMEKKVKQNLWSRCNHKLSSKNPNTVNFLKNYISYRTTSIINSNFRTLIKYAKPHYYMDL